MLSYAGLSRGSGPLDGVLAQAADSGWGRLELPARHILDQDPEVADVLAATTARLL
ncbi:hypothetical protein ACWEQO_02800 [Streptomyces sp. NPDC004051]